MPAPNLYNKIFDRPLSDLDIGEEIVITVEDFLQKRHEAGYPALKFMDAVLNINALRSAITNVVKNSGVTVHCKSAKDKSYMTVTRTG